MKISVCFKVLPDYDKVPKKDWERPERLDFEYVKNMFGVFDEGALESALVLKEEMRNAGHECFAEAVTYGAPDEIFVSTLYAVGFDRVVEIHGRNLDFFPENTAEALAEYFSHNMWKSGSEAQEECFSQNMRKSGLEAREECFSHNMWKSSSEAQEECFSHGKQNPDSENAAEASGDCFNHNSGNSFLVNTSKEPFCESNLFLDLPHRNLLPGNTSKESFCESNLFSDLSHRTLLPRNTPEASRGHLHQEGQDSYPEIPDIILLGKMTGPNDSGLVPYFLAQKSGYPILNKVNALKYEDGKVVICRRETNSLEKYIYEKPLIAVVEDADRPYLRLYTLRTMMESKDKKAEIVEYKGRTERNAGFRIEAPEVKKSRCEFPDIAPWDFWKYAVEESRKSKEIADFGKTEQKKTDDREGRDVYSGYLRLKYKTSLIKGKVSDKGVLSTEELKMAISERQALYRAPDSEEKSEAVEENIADAETVLVIGRGVGNKENYQRLKKAAENLGIPVGCTRLVAMNGYEDYSKVVGISGKTLKARLCICIGVSGAGPFCQGIKDVKKVVAINCDRDALIFDRADVGLVCDVNEIIKHL